MKRLIASLIFVALAACQAQEPVGYLTLTLPETASEGKYRPSAALSTLSPADVKTWTVIVAAEDMEEPIIVEAEGQTITVPVKAGLDRIVHVAGRGEAVEGIVQGFDGETVVDVPEEGNTEVSIDVYRSVTVDDQNAPMNRYGELVEGGSPDIRTMTVVLMSDSVDMYTTMDGTIAAPWNASRENAVVGTIEFDADANPLSGESSQVQSRMARLYEASGTEVDSDARLGVDVAVDLVPAGEGSLRATVGGEVMAVDANFSGRAMSVSLPYDLFGEKPKVLRFAGFVSNRDGNTDFVPESGYVEISIEETTPVEYEPQAITGFDGTLVQDTGKQMVPPQPAIDIGVDDSVHIGWRNDYNSAAYRFSDDGRIFSPTRRVDVGDDLTRDIKAVDVVASRDERSAGAFHVLFSDSTEGEEGPGGVSSVFPVASGSLGPEIIAAVALYNQFDQRQWGKIVAFGEGYLVAGDRETSYNVPEASGFVSKLAYVRDGEIVHSLYPSLPTDVSYEVYYQQLVETASGAKLIYYTTNYTNYENRVIVFDVTPTADGFSVGAPKVTTFATSLSGTGLDAALWNDRVLLAVIDSYATPQLTLRYADGTTPPTPEAFHQTRTEFFSMYGSEAPNIMARFAVSPDGRLGIVWHEGPELSASQYSPKVPLARTPSSTHTIWYAEILPGESAYSAPVQVGPGLYADLAYDSLSRPVVAVGYADYTYDDFAYDLTVHGSNVSIYRGK